MKTSSKFNIPNYDQIFGPVKEFVRNLSESLRKNHEDIFYDLNPNAIKLTPDDVTPSVKNGHGKLFYTANTVATAITDFEDAQEGQRIMVLCLDTDTSIADGGNFKLSANWTPNADDTLTLVFYNNYWHECARSSN